MQTRADGERCGGERERGEGSTELHIRSWPRRQRDGGGDGRSSTRRGRRIWALVVGGASNPASIEALASPDADRDDARRRPGRVGACAGIHLLPESGL